MKKFILTLATAALIFGNAMAQNKPSYSIDVKASKHEKQRGANPQIKVDEPTTDVEMAKPAGFTVSATRGANVSNLSRKAVVKTRGANTNIKSDVPAADVEKVRPSYSKVKQMQVSRKEAGKMRGANTNITNDEPSVDKETARPANYEAPNTKGRTVKQVSRHSVDKTRGANPNIKTDCPTTDVEQSKQGK